MTTSRLLTRIEAAIQASPTQVRADCLRAERAGHLARLGRMDEARQSLSSLHMQYASQPNASVSAWLALADGLLGYFSDMSEQARDKMRRAHALSGASRDMPLHALSAAWLALTDFMAHDFDAMGRHLADALRFADADHHAAQTRAAMLVGQVYHFACRFDLAQPWYAKARQHATADGDEASLAAVIHNMAWMHANQSRQALLCGAADGAATRQAALGAQSSANFDTLLGLSSLDALVPILRAQVLALQGEWGAALMLFDGHVADAMAQGLGRMQANLRAEMAWCRLQAGQAQGARDDTRLALLGLEDECDVDDRAAAHSRLAMIWAALGDDEAARRHAEQAEREWAVHVADQARAIATIDEALELSRSD